MIFNNVYIKDYYGIVGPKEKEVLKDMDSIEDYYNGNKTHEECEIELNKKVIEKLSIYNPDYIIGGDLFNQIAMTNYANRNNNYKFIGIYSACATFIEGLLIGSILINKKVSKHSLITTSSHLLNSEKQFRYPVEYGASLHNYQTITATGAVGALLDPKETDIKIESGMFGSVVDYGIKDAANMGAIMAPSAYDTLKKYLEYMKRDPSYFDLILTGDLGRVGSKLFIELCKKDNIKIKNHMDAGSILNKEYAGSSGPICLPLILFNNVLNNYKYKKICLIGTGALVTPTLTNEHKTIPAISHIISLEVL